jgi:uncharacterized protein
MRRLQESLIALRDENCALHWAVTRPEDNTPAAALAAGHFVQVAFASTGRKTRKPEKEIQADGWAWFIGIQS